MPRERGGGVNCFALLSRDNRIHRHLTQETVNAAWVSQKLDALSLCLERLTVVVLDNASTHVKAVKERGALWQERGLFVFSCRRIVRTLILLRSCGVSSSTSGYNLTTMRIKRPCTCGFGRLCRRPARRCGSTSSRSGSPKRRHK